MPSASHALAEPAATAALARSIASIAQAGDVVLLRGDLGAGKTYLARELCIALGVDPAGFSSPTFSLLHLYPVRHPSHAAIRQVAHLDAYRLHDPTELDTLGWDRIYDAQASRAADGTIILIEWPERLGPFAPPIDQALLIELEHAPPGRRVTLTIPQPWLARTGGPALLERPPIRCRVTGAWVEPTSPTYPFKDDKARLADLNRWFTASYSTSRPVEADDELES